VSVVLVIVGVVVSVVVVSVVLVLVNVVVSVVVVSVVVVSVVDVEVIAAKQTSLVHNKSFGIMHCISKSILDIFDCNLKTNYQILIICG